MNITVIGTGYVGLVSGTCFAEFGYQVTCVDVDIKKIDTLKNGGVPIYEPGLDLMIKRNAEEGRLKFSSNLESAITQSDLIFLAVGTPTDSQTGKANLSYIKQAAIDIAKSVKGHQYIVIKSTVPVGTAQALESLMTQTNPNASFEVISNPEFLREGAAIEDFMRPDRVVVGCRTVESKTLMGKLYRPLTLLNIPVFYTSNPSAELIKYAANAFLAMKIAFINEIGDLSEICGADIQDIAQGIGMDHRIGPKFLQTSPGYGGSCFPKDTLALRETAQDLRAPLTIVDAVIQANDRRKAHMAERIVKACGGSVQGKRIAVLGLTFKPDTDDMRDSVSLDVIPALQKQGAIVTAYDPKGVEEAQKLLLDVNYALSAYECMQGADALVILTEWNIFRGLDLNLVKQKLAAPLIIDLRNIYNPQEMADFGFTYHSLGRPSVVGNLQMIASKGAIN